MGVYPGGHGGTGGWASSAYSTGTSRSLDIDTLISVGDLAARMQKSWIHDTVHKANASRLTYSGFRMRRSALYSSSVRPYVDKPAALPAQSSAAERAASSGRVNRLRHAFSSSNPSRTIYLLWSAIGALALMLAISLSLSLRPAERKLTQEMINAAVLKTLETTDLPSAAARLMR